MAQVDKIQEEERKLTLEKMGIERRSSRIFWKQLESGRSPFETFSTILENSRYIQYFSKRQTGNFLFKLASFDGAVAENGYITVTLFGTKKTHTDPHAAFNQIKEAIDLFYRNQSLKN